jgi:hypothetical protein
MKNHHIPPLVMMLETFARFFCLSFLVIGTASTGWSVDDVKLPGLDRSLVDAFIQRRKAEPDWLKHAMSFLEKMTTRDYIGAYECLAPDIAKCMKKDAFDRVCRLDETGASAGLVRGSPRTKRLRITGIDEPFAPPGTPVGLATQIAVVGFLVEDETRARAYPDGEAPTPGQRMACVELHDPSGSRHASSPGNGPLAWLLQIEGRNAVTHDLPSKAR